MMKWIPVAHPQKHLPSQRARVGIENNSHDTDMATFTHPTTGLIPPRCGAAVGELAGDVRVPNLLDLRKNASNAGKAIGSAPQTRQSHRLRRDCRQTMTPQRLSVDKARQPQQDASTSGVTETSGMRRSAGLCRDTKPKSPQRHGRKIRLPRQRVRNDAATPLVERTGVPEQ